MYKQEIKAVVNQGWGDFKTIYLVKRDGDKVFNGRAGKEGEIVWTEVKEGLSDQAKPFLKVSAWIWQEIVDALTKETPPSSKERIDGELGATKYHLEDLRKLLKVDSLKEEE